LSDDVIAVAYVDLEKIDLSAALNELINLKIVPERERDEARKQVAAVQRLYAELPMRGARRLYVLLRVSDVFQGGPLWIVEVAEKNQAPAVVDWLKPRLENAEGFGDVDEYVPREMHSEGKLILGAASKERLDALRKSRADSPREDAVAALKSLGDADACFVAFGDQDSRRVVREMFPQLPPPFMEIDGKLLADGIHWVGLAVALKPKPVISLVLETSGKDMAVKLDESFEKAVELAKASLMAEMINGPPVHKKRAAEILPLLPMLAPRLEDARLSIKFGDDEGELAFVHNMLPTLLEGMRRDAYRNQRMNQFKQMALGMLNHESSNKSYPASASYDATGRPLLSWRVHVLPYLEQQALYKQFHLDEPWDSEHNRKLIERMPEIYADPDPAVRNSVDKGHTTYAVPVGEGLIFEGRDGTKIRDIKDGLSNTILVVEVVPERAVPWTKPADWEVDLKNSLKGIKREDRDFFTIAFADGSVHVIHINGTDAKTVRARLTRAGGE
jgi:hypothetical protein